MKKNWKTYVKSLPEKKKEKMLLVLLDYLMDIPDAVSYREGGPPEIKGDPPSKECIYWTASGEDILKP